MTLGVSKSCSSMQIMREIALFSGKIYTPQTNFTRPPVVTVATNLNSACPPLPPPTPSESPDNNI